jgi:hypothetical protein
MFAEAMHAQKKPAYTAAAQTNYIPDLTFLTNSNSGEAGDSSDADRNTDAIADDVMQRVAAEMGILNSAELLRMRDRVKMPLTYVFYFNVMFELILLCFTEHLN